MSVGGAEMRVNINLSGAALAEALGAALFRNAIGLGADGHAAADSTAILDSQLQSLAANGLVASDAAGTVFLSIPVTAAAAAQAAAGAGMSVQVRFDAMGLVNALATGTLADSGLPLAADGRGNAVAAAHLGATVSVSAMAANDAKGTAAMSVDQLFAGAAATVTDATATLTFGQSMAINSRYIARGMGRSYIARRVA